MASRLRSISVTSTADGRAPLPGYAALPSTTTAPTTRARSSTLDNLSITSIASSPSSLARSPYRPNANPESPTWLLSDLLQNFSVRDRDDVSVVTKANDLVLLLSHYPSLKQDIEIRPFISRIIQMLHHHHPQVRALGYRVLRYSIVGYDSLTVLVHAKVLIFIIVTLSTRTTLLEKEEALKLVRLFFAVPRGADNLSIGVVKCLISLAVHPEEDEIDSSSNLADDGISENFTKLCVETLCELALLKPELAFHSGALKVIINVLVNGPVELSMNCTIVVLALLDRPESRKFLRNGIDLNSLISPLSQFEDQASESKKDKKSRETRSFNKRLVSKSLKIAFLVSLFLKNWNGLLVFSIHNFQLLHDLVDLLKKRNVKLRNIIMDIMFDVLHIKTMPWLQNSYLSDSIKALHSFLNNDNYSFSYAPLDPKLLTSNFVNHYVGLLVQILVQKADLFQRLNEIITDDLDEDTSNRASLLFAHLIDLAHTLLPVEVVNRYVTRPIYAKGDEFIYSLAAMAKVELVTRTKVNPIKPIEPAKQKLLKAHVKSISIASRINVDDLEFKTLISNTRVLTLKEYDNWNWSLLAAVIQGPLRNPKRLEELVEKTPKFLKRLISFYRPFKFRFCNVSIASTKTNHKRYISTGTLLIESLISTEKGVKYLASNKFLPQISEIFAQVDPFSGILAKEPILSRKRLENTLSIGYIKFVGALSQNPNGIKMLEQWQLFTIFNNIIEGSNADESNNYLIINLLNSLDFSNDNQIRLLLVKALSVSNDKVKTFIIDALLADLLKIKQNAFFVLKLLVNLIYDSNSDIVLQTINLVYDFCVLQERVDMLNFVISYKPSIGILLRYPTGMLLLKHFCTTSTGFRFLNERGFISSQLDKCIETLSNSFEFVRSIETSLTWEVFPYFSREKRQVLSRHFFYFLLSTEEGFSYFVANYHYFYEDLIKQTMASVEKLRLLSDENSDEEEDFILDESEYSHHLITVKQNLWILGEIASAAHGIQLLDPMYGNNASGQKGNIIDVILQLFHHCPVWQIRGIAFYQLGKIGATPEGVEILDELDWCCLNTSSLNLSYPKDVASQNIFNIQPTNPYRNIKYYSIFSGNGTAYEFIDIQQDDDEELANIESYEELIDKILNYVNHLTLVHGTIVLARIMKKAMKELNKIKLSTPQIFHNLTLFLKVIKIIDKGNYDFNTKCFIFDLFKDTKVMELLVRRDRKNSVSEVKRPSKDQIRM